MTLIGILVVGFVPLFIMSAKTNDKSTQTLESTYLGMDAMEIAYNLSNTISYTNLDREFVGRGYEKISRNTYAYEYNDERYLNIKFTEVNGNNLVRVMVKVYKDKSMNELEIQYETLLFWTGGASLGEE